MKKEFTTSKGLVIIERNILYVRNSIHSSWDTAFAKIGIALLPPVFLVLVLIFEHGDPFRRFRYIALSIILIFLFSTDLFKLVFKTSYSNRIPMSRIVSTETKEDENGLEIHVLLRLKNGRTRTITFRRLEHQYEGLLSEISLSTPSLDLA